MKNKMFGSIILFSLILVLSGCASSKRMNRLSPLSEVNSNKMDPDRANMWPLVYKNYDNFSILWPIIDLDKNGLAIRPLFNKDYDEYSILFPLTAWNPVNGDGWLVNTYWNNRNYGSFPFFHINKKNGFNFIFPYWWNTRKDSHGVFVVYTKEPEYFRFLNYWEEYYNKTSFKNVFFPLWMYKNNDKYKDFKTLLFSYSSEKDDATKSWKMTDCSLLFSLLAKYSVNSYRSSSYIVPFYYYRNVYAGESDLYTLFYTRKWNKKGDTLKQQLLFGTLYNEENYKVEKGEPGSRRNTLFGTVNYETANNKSLFNFFPFYLYNNDVEGKSISGKLWHLSGKVNVKDGDENTSYNWLFPIYFYYENETDRDFYSALYFSFKNHDYLQKHYLCGLINTFESTNNDDNAFSVWPLYSQRKFKNYDETTSLVFACTIAGQKQEENRSANWLFPFYFYEKEICDSSTGTTSFTSLPFSCRRSNGVEKVYSYNDLLLGILWSNSKNDKNLDALQVGYLGEIKEHDYRFLNIGVKKNFQHVWNNKLVTSEEVDKIKKYQNLAYTGEFNTAEQYYENIILENIDSKYYKQKRNYYYSAKSEVCEILSKYNAEFVNKGDLTSALINEEINNLIERSKCEEITTTKYFWPLIKSVRTSSESDQDCLQYFFPLYLYNKRINGNIDSTELVTLLFNKENINFNNGKTFSKNGVLFDTIWKYSNTTQIDQETKEVCDQNIKRRFLNLGFEKRIDNKDLISINNYFWPFYRYRSKKQGDEFSYKSSFFFNFHYSVGNEKESVTSLCRFLYRREKNEEGQRIDIFPGISVNSGKKSGFSFFYRVINICHDEEHGYHGHFLFIPWGK